MMKMNKREFLWRFGLPAAVMLGGLLLGLGAGILMDKIELRQAGEAQTLPAEAPADGIGRITAARYLGGARTAMPERAVRIAPEHYTEGEGPAPEWWMPDEPMAVEWMNNAQQSEFNPIQRTDAGCPYWNVDSMLYGWSGHSMESWEMDLFARVFYLEFWQPDMVLCEAGCDAILQLWDLNGGTMFDTLSAITENGAYAFSTWPDVWATEYDADGLAWCRAYCEERFYSGPEWIAQYFRKGYYHDWGEWSPDPAYEIGGIYFSVARG